MVDLSSAENIEKPDLMPDLTKPRHGFHHTIDSALLALLRMGVGTDRITIKKAGRGWKRSRVIGQMPVAGAPLGREAVIELTVEGDGMFLHLPVGMREASREGEVGTQELLSIFDDAIEKASVHMRLGGLFFDVRPENHRGCARWIKLFGVEPEDWPKERLYRLAVLLPCLRYLTGRESGLRLAMRMLLDIEIASIAWRPRRTLMDPADRSSLGSRDSRLGVDLILGDGIDDEALMEITLRAETLEKYHYHQTDEGQKLIKQVMRLVAPYHWVYRFQWLIGDVSRAPRLGIEIENAVLGVNSHMGNS
ncbi:MAG: type VI secretion system baseplate subunit TssG [Chloracidobacterium sp.]|nr:type VI secretion system baseplate subunit TssG [Chloracidobacterium sp.]